MQFEDSVRTLKNVGDKRAAAYEKLHIATVGALLRFYPRAYEDWSRCIRAAEAQPGVPCCIRGYVLNSPTEHRVRKGMTLYRFRVSDGQSTVTVTLFNNRFAAARVRRDAEILLFGTVVANGRQLEMTSPLIEPAATGNRIRPIYRQTEGLSSRMIEGNIAEALEKLSKESVPEPLEPALRRRQGLLPAAEALAEIHRPTSQERLESARRRLVFEELYLLQLGLLRLKGRGREETGARIRGDFTVEFEGRLPFRLTGAQRRAIADCVGDLQRERAMSRLVQGDVGSGKTAVAAGVAYTAIRAGWQVAMMAPTEILAQQHAASLQKLLGESIRVACITGSLPAARRRALQEKLENGEIDFAVGTHALLSDTVHFARLGLVITDEQHRFGVRQRARLAAKGPKPHLLVMSATPIPRTLALMLYGDLDVSVLDELPPGRQSISTFAVSSRRKERAYAYVRRHLDEGRQGFIVCPLVENEEAESNPLQSATQLFEQLATGPFSAYRLGLLHGQMPSTEKEQVMTAFAAGDIQLLISTTVIEVGVDVPNAVILVVENAERFGLAQLHQLRGRVGRSEHPSTCILISDHNTEETRRRLQILCETTDGFRIANEDLKLRGPGDFFGDRQHGLPRLHMAELTADPELLQKAQQEALRVLESDPTLAAPEHRTLAQGVEALFGEIGEAGFN